MARRRVRVKPPPEGVPAEEVRCPRCGKVFAIERGRQFAMCPRCGEVMGRNGPAGDHADRQAA